MSSKDHDLSLLLGVIWDRTQAEVSAAPKLAAQRAWSPRIDLLEAETHFLIRIELPGVESLRVSVSYSPERHSIVVRGERSDDLHHKAARYAPLQLEIENGEFYREVPLPAVPVDSSSAKAQWKNGVLSVILPKEGMGTTITIVETIAIRKPR